MRTLRNLFMPSVWALWLPFVSVLVLAGCARGPQIEVVEVAPDGEVQRTTNLTFVFSDDVVGDSLLGLSLENDPVVFEPPLPGRFEWIAPDRLRFFPDVMLAPSTEYTAALQPRVLRRYGYALEGERTFRFHTPRLAVRGAYVGFEYDPSVRSQARLVSTIEFNAEVDPRDVAERVTLRYADGDRIPFEVKTTAPGLVVALEAPGVERGDVERRIELHLASGLLPLGGNLGLETDFVRPAELPGQNSLKVEQVTTVRETAHQQLLRIQFSLPVRAEDAASFITIQPEVEVEASVAHQSLRLRGAFDPAQTYQVTIREGLPALDGARLGRDFQTGVQFQNEDIPPQLDFVGAGYYLTRSGNLNLGLATVNVGEVTLEIDRIYANNLVQALNQYDFVEADGWYDWRAGLESIGKQVYSEDLTLALTPNEEVITPVNIRDYLRDQPVGLFKVTARKKDERWYSAARWVVATDLGMLAKEAGDDLMVWVNALSSLRPVEGAELALYSRNNQRLMTARTGEDGVAVFENYARFLDEFEPYVVTAALGDDLSFLELTRRRIPTTDFDVGGQAYLVGGYEAFLYDERGVYRPGERVHVAALVRGPNTSVPQPFPVRLRVTGPDGRTLSEQRARLDAQGGASFAVEAPDYALTGRYTAALLVGDDEIGRTAFSVEEFVPDRMKVRLETDRDTYRPGETMRIDVEGITLFGPPASGRSVQAAVEIEPFPFAPPSYRSFTFGSDLRAFNSLETRLDEARLDAEGHLTLRYPIPQGLRPPMALRAVAEATVLEAGGRGVTEYAGAVIHPYDTYVGLRPRRDGYAEPGQPFAVEAVVLDPKGKPVAGRRLRASLVYVYWNTIWQQDETGRYRYVSEKSETVESAFALTSEDGIGRFTVTPQEYGQYRIAVEDPESGALTTLEFYSSGWGYAPWALDQPDRIQLELDKEKYQAGETARVLVRAPFPGRLLLTVERERVFERYVVELEENTGTIDVPITDAYKPNVYVSAHLIRSTSGLERDEAARAFGVVPLFVDAEANRLAVSLEAPSVIEPRNRLQVNVEVEGGSGRPFLTIAAVDEGITQLTDFQMPDPHAFFFGKKRLQVATHDLYGVLLPEVAPTLSSPAGDVEAARRRRVNPAAARRVKPVAFWSGIVATDSRGRATVTFDIPQFNGTVRLMAVAADGAHFGSGEAKTIIRDEIVLTPTFPRFAGSGDTFVIPVGVYNGTGGDASFDVQLQAEGPVQLDGPTRQSVRVAAGREGQVYFKVNADPALGKATFRLSAAGGGAQTQDEVEVPIRPPVPYTTLAGSGAFDAAKPARLTFPAEFLAGTQDFELTVASFPAVRFAGSLRFLLQYPHGCAEQTVSRLFPLLAYYDLARLVEPQMFASNGADYFIEEGIAKLERMQLPSGAFAYWPGGTETNTWSTVYAAHFLVEARKQGYVVAETVYDKMLDAVTHIARSYGTTDPAALEQSAYATYVLALAGKPDRSTMLFLKNSALDRMPAYARYQLAGAFAHSGDLATAKTLLPQSATPPVTITERETGGNFNSPIKARAIMLDILAEVDPGSPQVPRLVEALSQSAEAGRWYTTQENAFAFLALGKILRVQGQADYTGRFLVDGKPVASFDEQQHRFTSKDWAGKPVTLEIEGSGQAYFYWHAVGLPKALDVDEFDRDLTVRRRYLTEQGTPVTDLTGFEPGDLLVAELTLSAVEDVENVAVIDLLPAGFEIENPRLQSRRGIDWIGDDPYTPDHMDIRDDRLVLYGDVPAGKARTFYYGVRAVTTGTFRLPPVRAEAMYDPAKASVASSGRVVVRSAGAPLGTQ